MTDPSFDKLFDLIDQQPGIPVPVAWIKEFGSTKAILLSCLAENGGLMELGVLAVETATSQKVASRHLENMAETGIIERVSHDPFRVREFIMDNKNSQTGVGDKICEWCRGSTYILHAHHYPLTEAEGGEDTVDICPNCHAEYHFLVNHPVYKIRKGVT